MADGIVKNNGNIYYIDDPNNVNVNYNVANGERENQPYGAPPYEDMFIYAELTAIRKARTVLVTTEATKYFIDDTGMNDTVNVNFMGNDQNMGGENNPNPNYLNFTTNYYDGSTRQDSSYESFGMSSIKVAINSSFIPQVNIQFVDVRGLSFFNQKASPYRILFDFPPPIFNLKIKGYYGKTLSYRLHLVKYTSEFKSENGNFVIDAQFVAMTYAPLTDVLFRYIINFPLINQVRTANPNTNAAPTNTNDLITKLKNLYSAVAKELKTDDDVKDYDDNIRKLAQNTEVLALLNNYKNELGAKNGEPYLLGVNYADGDLDETPEMFKSYGEVPFFPTVDWKSNPEPQTVVEYKNISDFDEIIKTQSSVGVLQNTNTNDRLFLAYIVTPVETTEFLETIISKEQVYLNVLNTYKTTVLNKAKSIGSTGLFTNYSISEASSFKNQYNSETNKYNADSNTTYSYVDITDFYTKLYKDRIEIRNDLTDLLKIINDKVNNMISTELGMRPTIYNVFKIILNDVDTFFETMRKTSESAEEHHNLPANKQIILGSNNEFTDVGGKAGEKIYAFPLIVDRQKVVCGGFREEKVAPLDLSNSLTGDHFPEMELVDNFINTFYTQTRRAYLANMKAELDSDGSHVWIPVSPLDSILASTDVRSPYIDIDTTDGGSDFTQINVSGDARLDQVLKIMIKRFYILTQSTYGRSFYYEWNKDIANSYLNLYASSEAANLATSLTQTDYGNNIKTIAEIWRKDVDSFYDYVKKRLPEYYHFLPEDKTYFPINNDDIDGVKAYVDKSNAGFVGLSLYEDGVIERSSNESSGNPVDKFQNDVRRNFWRKLLFGRAPENFYGFSQENVLYIRDKFVKADGSIKEKKTDVVGGVQIETRYLAPSKTIKTNIKKNQITLQSQLQDEYDRDIIMNTLLVGGNKRFQGFPKSEAAGLKNFQNVVDRWVDELADNDTELYDDVINSTSKLSALVYLSNFGWTQGPFNDFRFDLNNLVFDNPAAIDVPIYLPLYIGALIHALDGDGITVNEIDTFFRTGKGTALQSSGLYIFADLHDVDELIADNDKNTFRRYFRRWYDNAYGSIANQIKNLYQEVNSSGEKKKSAYNSRLKADGGSFFPLTVGKFLSRTAILTYSQSTFKTYDTPVGYTSIQTLNENTKDKTINDNYFAAFFNKLKIDIDAKSEEEKKKKEAANKLKGDEDIITQTYYSFKNINDKWLSSPIHSNPTGYPFNEPGKALIDSFAFVDRAMNPVGDTIINPEVLIELFNDHNVSVFSVLSQLLSVNGFEFFPLQNFMTHSVESWEDSFKINTNTEADARSAFVCMFVGGTSSYPSLTAAGFEDDGIRDITTTNALDFKTTDKDCDERKREEDDNQVALEDAYRGVRAFRVKFGEQNQSMFKDIKIDSKEYPETNESIQILSRLAGDNKLQAPIPKGQNLYSLYENRAYKATVTGLGNAMIQPTQYFQLDNIPMFNGAYLILGVEHSITPNKMTTSFAGTKILRFPIPRVTNPAAIFGFEGGESEFTSISDRSAADVVTGTQAPFMSQVRMENLDSVYGIDISRYQKTLDIKKAVSNPSADEPELQYAMIKISQNTWNDSQAMNNITKAKDAGLKVAYYHFGEPYIGNDPAGNATAQATFFVNSIDSLKIGDPDFPLVLDFENNDVQETKWSTVKANNDLWISTFNQVVKDAGYELMIYGNKGAFESYTSNNLGDIPLWHAQYPNDPEMSDPKIASGWNDWAMWQFSSQGRLFGYNGNVDINAMRKSYYKKYT